MTDHRLVPLALVVWAAAIATPRLPNTLAVALTALVSALVAVVAFLVAGRAASASTRAARPGPAGAPPATRPATGVQASAPAAAGVQASAPAAAGVQACARPAIAGPRARAAGAGAGRPSRASWCRAVALAGIGGCAAVLVTTLHLASDHAGPVRELAARGAIVTADLTVGSEPRRRSSAGPRTQAYVVLDATLTHLDGHGVRATVATPVIAVGPPAWQRLQPGERVRAVVRLAETAPYDQAAAVVSARSPPRIVGRPGMLDRATHALRAGLRAAVAPLPPNERGLLPALVDGDESALPDQLVADLRTSGLTHLTAVSGANLTIALALVLGLVRRARAPWWVGPIVGTVAVAGFVLLAQSEPSVLRAAAMGIVGLAGLVTGSRRRGLPGLAVAVTVLLLVDPWMATSYGFALSAAATAAIVVLAPRLTNAMAGWMPRWLAAGIAVPLAAEVVCLPLSAVLSQRLGLVAVPANLLADPAVAPATVLGLLATLVAVASPALAVVPAWLAWAPVAWIVTVATRGAQLPGATVPVNATPLAIAELTLACAVAVLVLPTLLRRRALGVTLAVALTVWIAHPVDVRLPAWASAWPPPGWVYVACDVGQGDGGVLRAGDGVGIVVDTGPDPAAMDRCLDELGIREVPYVLLTHFHADHIGGLAGVLDGRAVGEIGVSPLDLPNVPAGGVAGPRSLGLPAYGPEAVIVDAARTTRVRPVVVGERRRFGDVTWTVLSPVAGYAPEPDDPTSRRTPRASPESTSGSTPGPSPGTAPGTATEGSAENDRSVAILVEIGTPPTRMLFTGDLEPDSQQALLDSGVDLRTDVLKVPHHGSAYQDPAFLAAVHERLAVVSVGRDNPYGHPAARTIARLEASGATVARTDRDGAVAVVVGRRGLEVVRRHPP